MILNVHLTKVTNLSDGARFDEADPYVKFEIEQDNVLFDKDFGEMVSTKKKNEQNPVYGEDFRFELPTLENMELKCTVMDDDFGLDDKLGSCKIKLEKLDLSAESLEVRRKVDDNLFSPDSWIFLKLTWGEATEDADASGLSHVGAAAYECLRVDHPEHHGKLWNVTSGKVIGELHQTPKGAWPGGPTHPDGHSDYLPEIMGEILSRTTVWADVLSLGPPDGRFMDSFKNALATIAENAAESEKPVTIRMMFGNIIGLPTNCNAVRDMLTADLPEDANIHLWIGAWRRGASWNHAKIIAVDGKYLHTGGHNMWDGHYLDYNPIHDLSLELEGGCALDGHKFANDQWDFVESEHETFWGTIGSKMPDHLPQAAHTRVTISEWPQGEASEHAPVFRASFVADLAEEVEDAIPIITVGRYGALTNVERPADDAFIAMFNSAQTIIRLALQDLGPVCIPNTKIPLPGTSWPKTYFAALGKAIWERGVDVEILLSNPASVPGSLTPLEGAYGNGWDCNDVSAELIKTIKEEFPDAEDDDLRQKVSDNLRVCFIREECGNTWEDGMTMGMHAKHFIIDDIALYIGSQNLYVCDLAEWGVVIDDEEKVKAMMDEYWNPMWEHSFTGEDVDVDAVMDGLDIDRNGADPSEIDDETLEMMKQAELANAGCAKLDVYGSEDD
eukprot:CAMPEP_0183714334 /NCGR_PEP_ID=MMETSP0737-20130205/8881_1 /TAXON_ID=385413 /ORGANISM="Thalassiosira miniscula, Strain CCMP1093" /LENGTH=671 /DNA_ID=CAMNT_0025943241 /DNA_START=123 /DNA_END=2138 /DNA_ORIENTATION=-